MCSDTQLIMDSIMIFSSSCCDNSARLVNQTEFIYWGTIGTQRYNIIVLGPKVILALEQITSLLCRMVDKKLMY